MTGARTHKHPASLLLALVLLLCAIGVAACGGSSPSSSTSASVSSTTKTAGAGSTTGSGSGSTTGSTGSGTSSSTKTHHAKRRRPVKIGTGSSSATKRRARLRGSALRLCLEKNGIKSHSPGSKASSRAQLEAALARCDPVLIPKRISSSVSKARRTLLSRPSYRQALVRFTACMRSHGVPSFPEANTSGSGPLYPARSVKSSPQVRAAQKACIGTLTSAR